MKKLSVIYLVVCASSFMFSCQPSKILVATFEADALNAPPAKDLPGSPDGDVIIYISEVEPQLKVQNSGISGAKALHYTNVSIADVSGHQRGISFKGIGTALTKTTWITYTGQNTGASTNDVNVYVSDGHSHFMAAMRIRANGEVGLSNDLALGNFTAIGNVGSEVHTVVFTLSPSTLKYNVTIFKETGPAILAENKSMLTEDALSFNNPAHPTISFQHEAGVSPGHTYAVGSVSITRKKPK